MEAKPLLNRKLHLTGRQTEGGRKAGLGFVAPRVPGAEAREACLVARTHRSSQSLWGRYRRFGVYFNRVRFTKNPGTKIASSCNSARIRSTASSAALSH